MLQYAIDLFQSTVYPSFPDRHRKAPGSVRYARRHNHTFPDIVRGKFEWHAGSVDETDNHVVYTPG